MAKLRCNECGEVFDSNLQECPTCGCPAEQSNPVVQEEINEIGAKPDFPTTDTGYNYEKTILSYANTIWIIGIILAIIGFIVSLALMRESIYGALRLIGVIALLLSILYVIIAFIRVFVNISINLHEINMKTK